MSTKKIFTKSPTKRGDLVSADLTNAVRQALTKVLTGGNDIRVRDIGNKFIIDNVRKNPIPNNANIGILSDDTPEDVGTSGSAGTSNEASRSDHVHENNFIVDTVDDLPSIPASGMREVFWTSSGSGTGDDQVWRAYAGQSEWTPTQKRTTKSGTP